MEAFEKGILRALVRMGEIRDPYTAGHERRVAELGAAIAERLKLKPASVKSIRLAGMLHDIGKIAVPVEILNRPGRLSPHEMGMIRTHSEVGFDILKDSALPVHVAELVLEHHERLDGSGYPHGKKNGDISIESRVLAVADVVESMVSHRPYRPSLGMERAFGELENGSGTIYDSDVANACKNLFQAGHFSLTPY